MFKRFFAVAGLAGLAASLLLSALVSRAVATDGFPDVDENHLNQMAIEFLHGQEILLGDDETGEFRPEDTLNRAEFAAIIARVENADPKVEDYSDCFPDVEDQWFAPYVCWAKEKGYVKGYAAGDLKGKYGPAETLLNAEVAVVLSRVFEWNVKNGGEWYEPAMDFAKNTNVLDAAFDKKITRAVMAETVFRSTAVNDLNLESYGLKEAKDYVADGGVVTEPIVEDPTTEPDVDPVAKTDLVVTNIEGSTPTVNAESSKIMLLQFEVENKSETASTLNRLVVQPYAGTNHKYIRALSLYEGETALSSMAKGDVFNWGTAGYAFNSLSIMIEPKSKKKLIVYGDLDVEKTGMIQLAITKAAEIGTKEESTVTAEFPIIGHKYMIEVSDAILDSADQFPQCANWDEEMNLPYSSKADKSSSKTPAEPGGTVNPTGEHAIEPIDQGSRGICMAASVYSSLRWFEEKFDIDDLIEDGSKGLEDLVNDLYGSSVDTARKQLDKLKEKLEKSHPGCLDVEYDTQAGFNVSCTDLKKYHNNGCDIPLVFYCTKIDPATGQDVKGVGAESWGHVVDLTDVQVDSSDSNKCSVTFANSWKDSPTPRPGVDGLGSGRYEKADYNDDDESFKVNTPWGSAYRCNLFAAAYICIDKDKCEKK